MDNRNGHIYKRVNDWQVALPLHPDFGCEPNVFYVPPLSPVAFDEQGEFDDEASRIPLEYLREMFGSAVDNALETLKTERAKVASGGSSELIDILITRRWQDLMPNLERIARIETGTLSGGYPLHDGDAAIQKEFSTGRHQRFIGCQVEY